MPAPGGVDGRAELLVGPCQLGERRGVRRTLLGGPLGEPGRPVRQAEAFAPFAPGTYEITITATDAASRTGTAAYTLTVR